MARHAFLSTFFFFFFYKEGGWVAFRLSLLPLPLSFFPLFPLIFVQVLLGLNKTPLLNAELSEMSQKSARHHL